MKLPLFQIDAFTSRLFQGNPAAVCILDHWLEDKMQAIAAENNLSETAFIIPDEPYYQIRWFTPNTEVDLCGHATLASAYVIYEKLDYKAKEIIFKSNSGELRVAKQNSRLVLDFPALPLKRVVSIPKLSECIGFEPIEIYESKFDLLVILNNEKQISEANIDLNGISKLPYRGVIISAAATDSDFYSRCFYPACGVAEDPVTGSAHCVLAPYWSSRLGKSEMHAVQGSKRKGELWCKVIKDRVFMAGTCQLYLEGQIFI